MSGNCVLAYVGNGMWEVRERITSEVDAVLVEEGFRTDLASIPRLLWFIFPPFGDYLRAAIVHDWLIAEEVDRKVADDVFFRIMLEDGVSSLQAFTFWFVVRFNSIFLRRLRQWFPV